MALKPPTLMTIMSLVDMARLHPGRALPAEYHQSHPIPISASDGLRVAFLYCEASVVTPGEGLQLKPPSYVAFLHAETALFEELRAITPRELNLQHAADTVIGSYFTPFERMIPDFLTRQVRLYQAYDFLLGPFAAAETRVSPEVQKASAIFKTLFPQITEASLLPYYQAFGREFFGWLSRIGG